LGCELAKKWWYGWLEKEQTAQEKKLAAFLSHLPPGADAEEASSLPAPAPPGKEEKAS
jgi:hypothetical protein